MGCGCNKNKKNKASLTSGMITNKGFEIEQAPVVEQTNKREGPSLLQKAMNFGEALADHVSDGLTNVTKLQLAARLAVCTKCPFNKNGTCSECGCVIATKAKWRSADCPKEYWPTIKKD